MRKRDRTLCLSTIFLAAITVLVLTSCGGNPNIQLGTTQPGVGAANLPDDSGAPGADSSKQSIFPVVMRPQTEIEPGFKSASMAIPAMPDLPLPIRSVSSTEVEIGAIDYAVDLSSNRVEVKGDYLVFQPLWHDQIYDDLNDVAYCMYNLDLEGYTGTTTIGFDWAENGIPRIPQKYWIGLSNWDNNAWSWFEGPLDQVLTLSDFTPYLDDFDELLMVIAVIHRETVVVLGDITVGAPEIRGTGFEIEDIEITPSVPALFVPTLPASIDLTDGCAPVNDQGIWGSCTAFAVGDGAYNYELNKIYEQLGWDLSLAANRVSPKFVYIESGKDQGFPSGGDYGRYTDQVALGLMRFGAATELSAPYDLVYDDAWTADALEEAALLRTSNYTAIPCRSDSGIESIKTVLVNQQRPVMVSTQVDLGLFNYAPGTVWNFYGPSYGGHAMLIVGYDESRQAFKVRNSWSEDWGDNGYLWMSYASLKSPYNYYAQCGYIRDDYSDAVAQHFTGNTLSTLLPPSSVTASNGTWGNSIMVTWDDVPFASGYRVYRDTTVSMLVELGDELSFTDETIFDNLTHTYWVTAIEGITESSFSQPDLGYPAQQPQIIGVSPQEGAEGQQIRFMPEIYGDPNAEITWDFGGGAVPNTSTMAGPIVVLGSQGTYDATIEVTNAEGTTSFEWTLEVKLNEPPNCYLVSPPDSGIAPFVATMDGATSYDVDGFIVLYEWDFDGDGTYDLVSTLDIVEHTYTDPGQYYPRLRVMDDSGQYDTDQGYVEVDPENFTPYATFTATPQTGEAPLDVHFDASASFDNDGTIDLYEWDFETDGTYDQSGAGLIEVDHQYVDLGSYPATLRVTDNEGAQDEFLLDIRIGLPHIDGWTHHIIYTWLDENQYDYFDCTLVNGNPAIISTTRNDGLEYFSSSIATPTQTSDWSQSFAVADGGITYYGEPPSLCDIAGDPASSFYTGSMSTVRYDSSSWININVDEASDCGQHSSIALIDGKLAVAYTHTNSPRDIYYARATVADPTSPGDWIISEVDTVGSPSVGSDIELVEIGGMPYIAYGKRDPGPEDQLRLWLARGLTSTPDGLADWHLHKIDPAKNSGVQFELAELGGRPAVGYRIADGGVQMRFAWADSATPLTTANWNIMVIEDGEYGEPSLAVVGGVPMISYFVTGSGLGLTLAKASSSSPGGSGDWSFERLFTSDIWIPRNSLMDVGGVPVIIGGYDATKSLVYLTEIP